MYICIGFIATDAADRYPTHVYNNYVTRGLLDVCNTSKKQILIWNYFTVEEETKVAVCKVCSESVLRGGSTTKTFNTTNLVYHMKTKHHEQFIAHKKRHDAAKETSKEKAQLLKSANSLVLKRLQKKTCKLDINDSRSQVSR